MKRSESIRWNRHLRPRAIATMRDYLRLCETIWDYVRLWDDDTLILSEVMMAQSLKMRWWQRRWPSDDTLNMSTDVSHRTWDDDREGARWCDSSNFSGRWDSFTVGEFGHVEGLNSCTWCCAMTDATRRRERFSGRPATGNSWLVARLYLGGHWWAGNVSRGRPLHLHGAPFSKISTSRGPPVGR